MCIRDSYSNASRTQLFHLSELKWDEKICGLFGIHTSSLPVVCDSDSCFGMTDFEGLLPHPVPIHGMLGDSHAALFGQGCLDVYKRQVLIANTIKGKGSSVMENQVSWHHKVPNAKEYTQIMEDFKRAKEAF